MCCSQACTWHPVLYNSRRRANGESWAPEMVHFPTTTAKGGACLSLHRRPTSGELRWGNSIPYHFEYQQKEMEHKAMMGAREIFVKKYSVVWSLLHLILSRPVTLKYAYTTNYTKNNWQYRTESVWSGDICLLISVHFLHCLHIAGNLFLQYWTEFGPLSYPHTVLTVLMSFSCHGVLSMPKVLETEN